MEQAKQVIDAITAVESGLVSLGEKAADMQKSLATHSRSEVDALVGKVQEIASREAEQIISDARTRADAESKKIQGDSESRCKEIQSSIDGNFDDAVEYTVSEILKKE